MAYRVIVVGMGKRGLHHASAFAANPRFELAGVCSLDILALQSPVDQPVAVATDARRKEIYWAAYAADGTRTDGPAVVRPEELGRPGPFVGDPAFAARLGVEVLAADVTTAGLLRAAEPQLADPSSAGPLVPLYLRRPDATPPTAIKTVTPV